MGKCQTECILFADYCRLLIIMHGMNNITGQILAPFLKIQVMTRRNSSSSSKTVSIQLKTEWPSYVRIFGTE